MTKKMDKELVPQLRFGEFSSSSNDKWESATLGDYFEFKNGINADKEQYGSGTKFVNVSDILENDFLTSENITGKVEVSDEIVQKYEVRYGDVVFQRSSETRLEVGTANVYLDDLNQAVFGGFVIRGRAKKAYSPEFMNYLLKTTAVRKEVTSRSGGSTRYNIGQNSLSVSTFTLPSLPEQRKIAAFLTAVDGRLAGLRRKRGALVEWKRGVMQKMMGPEKLSNWTLIRAGELFKSVSNKNHEGGLPILAITQDKGTVYRDDLDKDIITSKKSVASYKIIEPGDFIISLRSFQGGIEYSEIKGICSPAYTILKPTRPIVDDFYKAYFKKDRFVERLSKTTVGIREGKQISYSAFAALKVPYPPLSEQRRIATFLRAIDERIGLVEGQLAGMEAFKRGLLQNMFT